MITIHWLSLIVMVTTAGIVGFFISASLNMVSERDKAYDSELVGIMSLLIKELGDEVELRVYHNSSEIMIRVNMFYKKELYSWQFPLYKKDIMYDQAKSIIDHGIKLAIYELKTTKEEIDNGR